MYKCGHYDVPQRNITKVLDNPRASNSPELYLWCVCEHAVERKRGAVYGGGVQPDGDPGHHKQAQGQR